MIYIENNWLYFDDEELALFGCILPGDERRRGDGGWVAYSSGIGLPFSPNGLLRRRPLSNCTTEQIAATQPPNQHFL